MKLSDLEKLVKALRKCANENKVDDPTVRFYDSNRAALLDAIQSGPFVHMNVADDVADSLHLHVIPESKDFEIPLDILDDIKYN